MSCIICSHDECESLVVKEMVYSHCRFCGSISLLPPYRLSAGDQKKRYLLHENTLDDAGYRSYLEQFFFLALTAYTQIQGKNPDTILDYGSGPNPCLVQLMKDKGFESYGWDPFFNQQGMADLECGTVFDMITCLEVAEHFECPADSFKHLSSLLRKGGIAVIGTNLIPEPDKQPFATWWYRFDPTHVTFYSLKGLQIIAQEHGLEYVTSKSPKVFVFQKQ